MKSPGAIALSVVLVAGCRLAADPPPGSVAGGSEVGERSITAVSYGGSYARAVVRGYHESFTEATGVRVDLADFQGGLAQVRAQVEAGAVHWDVVDLSVAETVSGCDEGVLELIDPSILPAGPNGELPEDDFLPEMNTECGVGNLLFSSIFAYNREVLTGPPPTRLADFFDLERFPGRRGVRRSPEAILEMALMADGSPRTVSTTC